MLRRTDGIRGSCRKMLRRTTNTRLRATTNQPTDRNPSTAGPNHRLITADKRPSPLRPAAEDYFGKGPAQSTIDCRHSRIKQPAGGLHQSSIANAHNPYRRRRSLRRKTVNTSPSAVDRQERLLCCHSQIVQSHNESAIATTQLSNHP